MRVLFVDDDSNLLQSLRRNLRRQSSLWEMEFIDNPLVAFKLLSTSYSSGSTFDVLVSDLQMPGLNGIELLKRVSDSSPETIPIILSGQVNKELLMYSIKTNTQVLLKPCKIEDLISAIERSYTLRTLMRSERVKSVVNKLSELPSLSQTHNKLLSAIENDNTPISKIVDLIKQNVSVAAKVMQLANSAFFGSTQVAQLESAIRILGLTHIRLLVLASDIFLKIDSKKGANFDMSSLIRHSTNVGVLSGQIARNLQLSPSQCEAAHIAGLLHDIGKIILLKDMPQEMSKVTSYRAQEHCLVHIAETAILGCSHAEVGAYLLGVWRLPDIILEAVIFHHQPLSIPTTQPTVLSAVFFADILEHILLNEHITEGENEVYETYAKQLGVSSLLPRWKEEMTRFIGTG